MGLSTKVLLQLRWLSVALVVVAAFAVGRRFPVDSLPKSHELGGTPEAASNLAAGEPAPLSWRQIESTNYETYVTNLFRVGCPEATVRDILLADLLSAGGKAHDNKAFWSVLLSAYPDRERAEEAAWVASHLLHNCQFVLSEPEVRSSSLVATGTINQAAAAKEVSGGTMNLAAEITPAATNFSTEVSMLRTMRYYDGLALSQEEALALANAERVHGEETPRAAPSAIDSQSLEVARKSELRSLLGDQRYLEYERLQNPDYVRFRDFLEDHAASPEEIAQAYDALSRAGTFTDPDIAAEELASRFGKQIAADWKLSMARADALVFPQQEPRP